MSPFEVLNEQYHSNIFSFAAVASKFRITIDTELKPSINLDLGNGTIIMFNTCGGGLN